MFFHKRYHSENCSYIVKRHWPTDIHQVLLVIWVYTSRCWKLLKHWGKSNNLSTLAILNKCATVKINCSPSSFPLGQAVATVDVTERLEMLPSLPSHSGIFLLHSFVHLTVLCLKCVFTPSLHDQPTQSEDRLIKTTDLQQGAQRWV